MVLFVLKGGECALRYLRYKQLSRKIVKMSLVDNELNLFAISINFPGKMPVVLSPPLMQISSIIFVLVKVTYIYI